MKKQILISFFSLLSISSISYAQAPIEPTIKCEIQEVVTSDTSAPKISTLASASKPLSGFWLSATAPNKGFFLVTGGIQNGVASGILTFKDFVGNHSVSQSMTFAPGSNIQIDLGTANPSNGFGGTDIRLSCDVSSY